MNRCCMTRFRCRSSKTMSSGSAEKLVKTLEKGDPEQRKAFVITKIEQAEFYGKIIDAMADGIVVFRPSLEVELINKAVWELLDRPYPSKAPRTRPRLTELNWPRFLEEQAVRFALSDASTERAEHELPGKEPRWLEVSFRRLTLQKGDTSQVVLMILRDTTDWHRAAQQRRRAEYWQQMATLAAGLAHEIKNPLNSLQIHAQLLQRALRDRSKRSARSIDKQRQLQSCDIIVEEIARLSRVVNDFLSAVRPSRPVLQRANINYHIERVVEAFRPEAETHGVAVDLALDYEIPPVDFDPSQMTQVLLNLLKNSLEALQGTSDPRIVIRTQLLDHEYAIVIEDNGHGISAEHLARVHEPFFTTKATGTGLGLAIVSQIVAEHGGKLSITSDIGRGTTVVLRFALQQRPVRLLEEGQDRTMPARPPARELVPRVEAGADAHTRPLDEATMVPKLDRHPRSVPAPSRADGEHSSRPPSEPS